MPFASTETYIRLAAALLLLGALLGGGQGVRLLYGARRQHFTLQRRDSLLRGWQLILLSGLLLLAAGLVRLWGQPLVERVVPPTLTPTASLTPSVTPSPTLSATPTTRPTLTLTASVTPTPSDTPTPSATPSATRSPTPALPRERITPAGTSAVTPPPEAVAADLRFSRRDNCAVRSGLTLFDQVPKTIYAHFYYDSWLPGMQWSAAWYRGGQLLYVETRLWDGSTGGCGFSEYNFDKLWWQVGGYEVQIFAGERWLLSGQFEVVQFTPTPTRAPTRTPRATPSATPSPRP